MDTRLILLGLLPFVLGRIEDWAVTTSPVPSAVMGPAAILTLILWGIIAYRANQRLKNTKQVVLSLNLVPFLVLALIFVQRGILGHFFGLIGTWCQLYFLPVLIFGFTLTGWIPHIVAAYCASFLLMVAASVVGCKVKRK